jgi:transposase-like protein
MTKRRRFTPEFKAQVVLVVLTGARTAAEACREYQLTGQVLKRWKAQFLEEAPRIFENGADGSQKEQRIGELERMVGRLMLELEVVEEGIEYLGLGQEREVVEMLSARCGLDRRSRRRYNTCTALADTDRIGSWLKSRAGDDSTQHVGE